MTVQPVTSTMSRTAVADDLSRLEVSVLRAIVEQLVNQARRTASKLRDPQQVEAQMQVVSTWINIEAKACAFAARHAH